MRPRGTRADTDSICGFSQRVGARQPRCAVLTLALVACTLEFTLHVNDSLQHFVVYWLYNGLVIAAGVVCIARGISNARERAAWILIGAAVVFWGVGNTIWTFAYVALESPPYPSLADAFWLAVYPPVYVALLLLLRSRAGGVRRSVWLDGVIASLAVAAIGTAVVFQAVLEATSGSKAAIATNLAYPLADLTTIALVGLGARRLWLANRPGLGL